jgi:hypothetical protein
MDTLLAIILLVVLLYFVAEIVLKMIYIVYLTLNEIPWIFTSKIKKEAKLVTQDFTGYDTVWEVPGYGRMICSDKEVFRKVTKGYSTIICKQRKNKLRIIDIVG